MVLIGLLALRASAADQFFAGDGSALNAAKWGTSAAGPFTSSFTATNTAHFSTAGGIGTGASINVGGIVASENFTLTAVGGTISFNSTVVDVDVASGRTVNLGLQAFSTAAGSGMNKKGDGVLALGATSGDMPGGFTLTSGTVVMLGANGLGNGTLAIDGGTLAASTNLNLSGRYGTGVGINGDFSFGSSTGPALGSANLTFNTPFFLANQDHVISLGGSGTYTLGGGLSLSQSLPGTNLTVNGSGGGKLVLTAFSNVSGTVTVSQARLEVVASLPAATQLTVTNGGTLLLSGATDSSKLNDSAPVTLGGSGSGKIDLTGITATYVEQVGALTLNASSSIDFGSLAGGNGFRFDDSSGNAWTGTLSIHNWTDGADHLYFGIDDNSGLTSSQLSQISFYSGTGTGFLGSAKFLSGGLGEVVPVPEPGSSTLAVGLLALAGWRERRRFGGFRRASRSPQSVSG